MGRVAPSWLAPLCFALCALSRANLALAYRLSSIKLSSALEGSDAEARLPRKTKVGGWTHRRQLRSRGRRWKSTDGAEASGKLESLPKLEVAQDIRPTPTTTRPTSALTSSNETRGTIGALQATSYALRHPTDFIVHSTEEMPFRMIRPACNGVTTRGRLPLGFMEGVWWQDYGNALAGGIFNRENLFTAGNAVWTDGCPEGRATVRTLEGAEEPCWGKMSYHYAGGHAFHYPIGLAALLQMGAAPVAWHCGGPSINNLNICRQSIDITLAKLAGADILNDWYSTKVSENLHIRWSFGRIAQAVVGKAIPYRLKKILDCNGEKTQYWDEYVSNGRAPSPPLVDVYSLPQDNMRRGLWVNFRR